MTETREYAVARHVRARLAGAVVAVAGLVVLVVTMVAVTVGLPAALVLAAAALAVVALVAAAGLVGRRWWVVRLDDTGYRVRLVRGVGRTAARWKDVEDLTTTFVSGSPCVVLRLRDGSSSTVPVDVVEGDREELVDELRRRLDGANGYRRR
ncbi:MAG TPA: hypothetical protein VFE07_09610 [Marmoricola sp.]|nr:hypothetical protein [Marmoricola sp.]